jgi:hypothetical protein
MQLAFKGLLIMAVAGLLAAAILILAKWIAVLALTTIALGALFLGLRLISLSRADRRD